MSPAAVKMIRFAVLAVFISCSLFFFYISPEKIIGWLGVENAYVLMFFLALIGGLTTFSGVPYHAILVMLASGGLDPLLLGLSASFGVMAGDSTSYFIGYNGGHIVPAPIGRHLKRFYDFCLAHPRLLPLGFFIYGSCVPFSNDFIVISMGLARYPFWRVMVPLGLGNLVFNTGLAFLSVNAYGFIKSIFPLH